MTNLSPQKSPISAVYHIKVVRASCVSKLVTRLTTKKYLKKYETITMNIVS